MCVLIDTQLFNIYCDIYLVMFVVKCVQVKVKSKFLNGYLPHIPRFLEKYSQSMNLWKVDMHGRFGLY